jgi:hypothetical protein
MEADWEVEIGGDAHAIEPDWAGFADLRRMPAKAEQLPEAFALPGMAQVLMLLNSTDSPVWTAKCDVWEMENFDPDELDVEKANERNGAACYVDMLSREKERWETHQAAAEWCRLVCQRLCGIVLRSCRVDLVVRAAEFAGEPSRLAVTAYASAAGKDSASARQKLAKALAALADTLQQME